MFSDKSQYARCFWWHKLLYAKENWNMANQQVTVEILLEVGGRSFLYRLAVAACFAPGWVPFSMKRKVL